MPKFVQEHMKEHEGSRLGFRESAQNILLPSIEGNSKLRQYRLMSIEIVCAEFNPEILMPCVQKNSASFFAVIKGVFRVTSIFSCRKDDAFQPFR